MRELESLESVMFEIFSDYTTYNRINGYSEDAFQDLLVMNKSDKMLQTLSKNDENATKCLKVIANHNNEIYTLPLYSQKM